jgi:hypothetical protein
MPCAFGIVGVPKRGFGPLTAPPQNAAVDWQHPLARGLTECSICNSLSPRNMVNGLALNAVGAAYGSVVLKVNDGRTGLGLDGSLGNVWIRAYYADSHMGDITVFNKSFIPTFSSLYKLFHLVSSDGYDSLYVKHPRSGQLDFGAEEGNTWTAAQSANQTIAENSWHTIAISGSGQSVACYVDGKKRALTSSNYAGQSDPYTQKHVICGYSEGDPVGYANALCYVWRRVLVESELEQLHSSPYQLFWAPGKRSFFFAPTAAPASTYVAQHPTVHGFGF